MASTPTSIYDFEAQSIDGQPAALPTQRGKVMLIVNTASACGFTPQFDGPGKAVEDLRDKGLVVLGFPSNEFGGQDPGSDGEIAVLLPAELRRQLPDDEQGQGQRRRGAPAVAVAHQARRPACWAARRSSGTSPSSWSAATAR